MGCTASNHISKETRLQRRGRENLEARRKKEAASNGASTLLTTSAGTKKAAIAPGVVQPAAELPTWWQSLEPLEELPLGAEAADVEAQMYTHNVNHNCNTRDVSELHARDPAETDKASPDMVAEMTTSSEEQECGRHEVSQSNSAAEENYHAVSHQPHPFFGLTRAKRTDEAVKLAEARAGVADESAAGAEVQMNMALLDPRKPQAMAPTASPAKPFHGSVRRSQPCCC